MEVDANDGGGRFATHSAVLVLPVNGARVCFSLSSRFE